MSVLQAQVKGADDAAALLRALVPDQPVKGMLVIGLDHEQRLCGVAVNPRHRCLSWTKVWELVDLAAELDACALVIGLFPAGGTREPTMHEVAAFVDLHERALRAQVLLLDCIVLRGGEWASLRRLSGRFPERLADDDS
jgi:hypothetical protein